MAVNTDHGADSEKKKRIQAFEAKCTRKHFLIIYLEHKTNDWVRSKINFLVGAQEPFLATVKKRKLALFGHITRHNSLSKTILQGILEGGQCCGWQRKCWLDNMKEWTSLPMPELLTSGSLPMPELLTRASCRKDRKSYLLNHLSFPCDDPIGQGTEAEFNRAKFKLDWTRTYHKTFYNF